MFTDVKSLAEAGVCRLSPEEIIDPSMVLQDFFLEADLLHSKEILWDWMKTTVTGGFAFLPVEERTDLVSFYESLSKAMEAMYVLLVRWKTNREEGLSLSGE